MDEWFENYAKIKARPSPHQTYRGYINNHIKSNIGKVPLEKLTSLELQKFCKKLLTSGRIDRSRAKIRQRFEPQDGAEHLPDHRLGHEAGQRATADCSRPHRGLCLAEAETQGDENAAH